MARLRKELTMNCTKCNTAIPDGAKFCVSCGQPVELDLGAAKCPQCGLELAPGMKFCTVCGASVDGAPAQAAPVAEAPAAPAPVAPAAPAATAVETPADPAVSVVSATMPAASVTPAAPTASVVSATMPAAAAVETPAASTPVATVVETASGNKISLTKQEDPSFTETAELPAYDFSAAAAATVTPIKKKNKAGKIAAIAGISVAGVAAACTGIYMFNKGPVMNLVMGDEKYAALVESKTFESMAKAETNGAMSASIKAMSAPVAAALMTNPDALEDAYNIEGLNSGLSFNYTDIIAQAHKSMIEQYGAEGISLTVNPSVKLTSTSLEMIGMADEVNQILDIVNGSSVTTSFSSKEDRLGMYAAVSDGKFTGDVNAIVTNEGKFYVSFPFGSDTAIMIPIESTEAAADLPSLDIDENEIKRLFNDLTEVYLEYYKQGEVEVEKKAEMTVAGATANGTLLTVTFTDEMLGEMIVKMGDTIAQDEYFCDKIVTFANECGSDLDAETYTKAIQEAFDVEVPDDLNLIVKTVVNKNNEVLAKSYALADSEDTVSLGFINSKEISTLDLAHNEKTVFSATVKPTDEQNGSVKLKFSDGEMTPIVFNIKYSDVKTEKFLKTEMPTGTYVFSIDPPEDFTASELFNDMGLDQAAASTAMSVLSETSITVSASVNDNTYTEEFTLEVPKYGSVGFKTSLKAIENADINVPKTYIDLTDAIKGGDISEGDYEKLDKMMNDILAAFENSDSPIVSFVKEAMGDDFSELGGIIGSSTGDGDIVVVEPEPEQPATSGEVSSDELDALRTRLSDAENELYAVYDTYSEVITTEEVNFLSELDDELYNMYISISDSTTAAELREMNSKTAEIEEQIAEFRDEMASRGGITGTGSGDGGDYVSSVGPAVLPDYNYASLSLNEFLDAVDDLEGYYIDLFLNNMDTIFADDDVYAVYEASAEAYDDFCNDLESFSKKVEEGNLNGAYLREAANSAQNFHNSVRALDEALNKN